MLTRKDRLTLLMLNHPFLFIFFTFLFIRIIFFIEYANNSFLESAVSCAKNDQPLIFFLAGMFVIGFFAIKKILVSSPNVPNIVDVENEILPNSNVPENVVISSPIIENTIVINDISTILPPLISTFIPINSPFINTTIQITTEEYTEYFMPAQNRLIGGLIDPQHIFGFTANLDYNDQLLQTIVENFMKNYIYDIFPQLSDSHFFENLTTTDLEPFYLAFIFKNGHTVIIIPDEIFNYFVKSLISDDTISPIQAYNIVLNCCCPIRLKLYADTFFAPRINLGDSITFNERCIDL